MKTLFTVLLSLLVFFSCKNEDAPPILLEEGVPLAIAKYRKSQISDVLYQLWFEIPVEKEKGIPARLILDLNLSSLEYPLYLDFKEKADKLSSVTANGENIPVTHEKEHLIIPSKYLKIGENSIKIDFEAGELSLNRNDDFLYTLLVPDRARTVFPCFDQPNIKANYKLNITAPKDWKVLCGASLQEKIEKGDFTEHQFGRTDKMSTYLFSFVAGNFQSVTKNKGGFDMTLLYRENNPEKIESSIDPIIDLHQQSISFLEEYTHYKFPFQKLDYAAIPGFQYGGMEHVGAIQYREGALFLDKSATENQKLGRAKLISHETAHMWFGDLVTMDWFNDVWMKEVFANFMADKSVNPAFPDINHELSFMTTHYPRAYSEDRTRGTNPIRQDLDNLKNAGSLYGSIIYNKAPIMMRQLEATMGKDTFQEGIQEYIKTYANNNADWGQLVDIMDDKTAINLKKWSEVWVNQSGRPVFKEQIWYGEDHTIKSFEIEQKAEDGSGNLWPQTFDIALVYPDSVQTITVNVSEEKTSLTRLIGQRKPQTIIYNSNGMGYGVFPIDTKALDKISKIENEVARGYAYINNFENALNGTISTFSVMEAYRNALKIERNELLINLLSGRINNLFWKYLSPTQRDAQQPSLENELFSLLQKDLPSNIKKTLFSLFRSIAYSKSGQEKIYDIWNKDIHIKNLKLNEDDFTNLAMELALYEHIKQEEILEKAGKAITNPDKLKRFQFLLPSLSSDITVRDSFFDSLVDEKNREKESWVLTALDNLNHPLRKESAIKYLKPSLDLLAEIQQTGDIFFPKGWLNTTIGNHTSTEAYEILETFLKANPDLDSVLLKKLLQASDDLYRVQQLNKNLMP